MGAELHVKELRQKIISLMTADFTAYPTEKYVISDRVKELVTSSTTVFVHWANAGPISRALNDSRWSYEFHLFLGVLRLDPDEAMTAMDLLLARTVKSAESHPAMDGYVIASKEEVYKYQIGKNPGDIDTTRGKDGANNYINFTRIKVFVETSQRGV